LGEPAKPVRRLPGGASPVGGSFSRAAPLAAAPPIGGRLPNINIPLRMPGDAPPAAAAMPTRPAPHLGAGGVPNTIDAGARGSARPTSQINPAAQPGRQSLPADVAAAAQRPTITKKAAVSGLGTPIDLSSPRGGECARSCRSVTRARTDAVDATLLKRADASQRQACADERDELLSGPVLGQRNAGAAESFGARVVPVPLEAAPRVRILVNVGELKLELGAVEALYVSMAIHDKRRGVRVSEDFTFEGDSAQMQALQGASAGNDVRTRCRQALFSLDPSYQSMRDLVLLVRVCKQLNNEFEKDQQPYYAKKLKAAAVSELSNQTALLCRNPQPWKYRQPFAWGARPVFLPNGDVDSRANRMDLYALRPGALADAALYEMVESLQLLKKQKQVCASVQMWSH
jgi:hypothetical protein